MLTIRQLDDIASTQSTNQLCLAKSCCKGPGTNLILFWFYLKNYNFEVQHTFTQSLALSVQILSPWIVVASLEFMGIPKSLSDTQDGQRKSNFPTELNSYSYLCYVTSLLSGCVIRDDCSNQGALQA